MYDVVSSILHNTYVVRIYIYYTTNMALFFWNVDAIL